MRTILAVLCASSLFAADAPSSLGKIFDQDLSNIEREIVPLAEAMPADKYDFAPTSGEFKGVRTFGDQVKHVATVIYAVSATILGEKNPIDMGTNENGPASVKGKEAVSYTHLTLPTIYSV